MSQLTLFASCPAHVEDLLEKEILRSGGTILKRGTGGHLLECSLGDAYRLILWSRIASRLLLLLKSFPCSGPEDVYREARQFDWGDVMDREHTISCACTVSANAPLPPKAVALKIKDGLVDYWRDKTGERPNVDRDNPDIAVHLHLHGEEASLYLDLSGEGLHRRGYRLDASKAGLKENTAAAILCRAGWPEIASSGGGLVDPLCGSGTFLIEAAFLALGASPRLHRSAYRFFHWKGHDPDLWETVFDEAESLWEEGKSRLPLLIGYDHDKKALNAARENIRRAGLEGQIHLEKKSLEDFTVTEGMKQHPGLIVANPPYGQRIGDKGSLHSLYRSLGDLGRHPGLKGWKMSVLSDEEALLRSTGLRKDHKNSLMNGPIRCSLYHFSLLGGGDRPEGRPSGSAARREIPPEDLTPEAEQFQNRLKKNLKHLRKWKAREEVTCYRLYDADLPNFNFAVDWYEEKWVHMQEYAPPAGVDEARARKRLRQGVTILASLLDIPESSVFLKQRRKQRGKKQYDPLKRAGERYLIHEGGCRFWVNFTDYLDTGIFLDHRKIRRYIHDNSQGKRVLNLFCYTGTASVMAAAGGAEQVVSVDSSATYLKWAKDNFLLNKLHPDRHGFVKGDVPGWLENCRESFDLIFLDPPTFSNSKSREKVMQIQDDHRALILQAMKCLRPDGLLIFSNNYKRFVPDAALFEDFRVEEVSERTQSPDFSRKGAFHRCWFITFPS